MGQGFEVNQYRPFAASDYVISVTIHRLEEISDSYCRSDTFVKSTHAPLAATSSRRNFFHPAIAITTQDLRCL
jgi:hypothetical protein